MKAVIIAIIASITFSSLSALDDLFVHRNFSISYADEAVCLEVKQDVIREVKLSVELFSEMLKVEQFNQNTTNLNGKAVVMMNYSF